MSGHAPTAAIDGQENTNVMLMRYDASHGCFNLLLNSAWQPTADVPEQVIIAKTVTLYDLDPNTGWPRSVSTQRTAIMDGQGQIDQVTLTYVPDGEP